MPPVLLSRGVPRHLASEPRAWVNVKVPRSLKAAAASVTVGHSPPCGVARQSGCLWHLYAEWHRDLNLG